MRRNFALVAGFLSLVVSAALVVRIIAIHKPGVIVIVMPAIIGSVLALRRPDRRGSLAVAVVLIGATAIVSLIGGVGLLYLPSIVLLLIAMFTAPSTTSHPRTT